MDGKAVVAGNICLDITPMIPGTGYTEIGQLLKPGKLVQVGGIELHTGGAVANTGLAMKFFGADVELMGKIGDDGFGTIVQKKLEEYGAESGMIVVSGAATSYTIVLSPSGIDRIFLHDPGASDTFTSEDIRWDRLSGVTLFHFGYPTVMRKMYEDEGRELCGIFSRVKSMGIATSLDMAGVDPDSEAGRADWNSILKNVLGDVDFFLPSIEELTFMLDRKVIDPDLSGISIEDDVKPLADRLLEMGAKVVLIKCGAAGIYYRTAAAGALAELADRLGLDLREWAGKEGFERSYKAQKIVSATGAGDTCIAAFLAAVMDHRPLVECLMLATAAGASCVEAYDALSGLLSFEAMEEKIRGGWQKNS